MNRTKIIYITAASVILVIFILIFVLTASQGKEIFLSAGCTNCHSFKGHGGETAPDLTAVGERRSTLWIMSQIKDPRSHNPDSRMPEFGHLSIFERYAIARYLRV
jgi:cbb3-type cytochrome oxidase cytochrome c subunit